MEFQYVSSIDKVQDESFGGMIDYHCGRKPPNLPPSGATTSLRVDQED